MAKRRNSKPSSPSGDPSPTPDDTAEPPAWKALVRGDRRGRAAALRGDPGDEDPTDADPPEVTPTSSTYAGPDRGILPRLAAHVRRLRGERGLTVRQLAARAVLSERFLWMVESGTGNIAIGRLERVAHALGVSIADLVAGADAPGTEGTTRIANLLRGRTPDEVERCVRAVELALGQRRREAIALLGLRGAGKSTLGAQTAAALGLEFVELDDRIEAAAGLSLAELFAIHGEAYYRRLEAQCLAALLDAARPSVVALGGGVVLNEEAFRLARSRCTTVWLKATPADHMNRVLAQGDRRPVADREDAMAELEAILAAREPYYRQADLSVDTSQHGERALVVLLEKLERAGWSRGGA